MRLRRDNPMNRPLQMTLIFEVIVFGLAFPGMVLVDDVPWRVALAVVLAACALAVIASGGLKKSWGHALGWLVQVIGIAMGLLTSMMYAVGIVFFALWAMCMVMGRKIEQRQQGQGQPPQP